MELNREKIEKELAMFIEDMPTDLHLGLKRTLKFREFLKDALALIKELTEELAYAEAEAEKAIDIAEGNIRAEIASGGTSCHWCAEKVRADTVRKMQERLNAEERIFEAYGTRWKIIYSSAIDRIAKEMLEEEGRDERQHT